MWRDPERSRRFPVLLAALVALGLGANASRARGEGLGAITYPEAGTNRLYAFKALSNGHLFVHYWDGADWNWADQGSPPGTRAVDQPSAVTYTAAGVRRIYAFVRGANGHLLVNWWNGSAWQWADQGVPPGTTAASAPSVITYLEGTSQRIYAFVRGANGRLFVNWWNGSAWQWANQGAPTGTTTADAPSVVTYQITERRIYAFARGTNGHLFVNWWNGSAWQWADQGMPSSGIVASQPSALTYLEGTAQRLYAFARGADGHLWVNFWDGTRWQWADQGRPPGASVFAAPTATTYRDFNVQRLYVFVRDAPARLFVNFWDGGQWQWAEQGVPATGRVRRPFDVVTYFEAGTRRIYSFVDDDQERLQLNFWNGSTWQWTDTWQPWTFDWGSIKYFQPNVAQGGRAVAIAVHPTDDRRILVASETGGLFRTLDRGRSWAHVRTLPTQWMQDVAYAPDSPDVVIAVARADYREPNGGGIWRSSDGGLTWTQPAGSVPPAGARCPARTGAYAVSFEPGSSRVYVATDCGLAVSDSLGIAWSHVVLDPTTPTNADLTQDRVWSVLARRGGHANAAADNGIWYRQSLGSWTRAATGPPQGQGWVAHAFAASPSSGDHLFLAAGGNRLFQSADGGRNWTNAAGIPKVYAFLRSATNELHANHWTGRQWEWSDHDAPPTSPVTATPAVVAYQNGLIYAFVHGSDGHIYVRYGHDDGWEWSDQGTPPAASAIDSPAAVAFPDRLICFTRTSAGGLAKNEWNEGVGGWRWTNQGTPPGTLASGRPSVISYDDGTRRVYAFTAGSNGRLFVNFWDGSTWRWADQGAPPGTTMTGSPDAITYRDGAQRIYVFVRAANGHLFVNYWDGGTWRWADQGVPSGTTVTDVPGAITYRDGAQRIYAFVRGANGRLHVNYWDGSVWRWADQGAPPGTTVLGAPAAITYFNDKQLIYAFVRGVDDHLFTNWWNGSIWQWADQGTPSGSTVAAAPGLVVSDDIGRWGRPAFVRTAPATSGDAERFDLWVGDGVQVLKGTFASAAGGPRNISWSLPTSDHADPADVAFDSTSARRPLLLASDGGLHVTADDGVTWRQAGAWRSGYNALQITEVMGQLVGVIGTATPPHLDLYYGTQDNHVLASADGGRTWPRSSCCEGFFLRGARQFTSDGGGNKITFVACGPCGNQLADPHFARVEGFPLPPDDDTDDTDGAEGNPVFLRQGAYVQRTVDNDTAPTDSIFKLTRSTGGMWATSFSIPQPVRGLASVAGDAANPTLYQAVVRPGLTADGLEQLGLTRISNVLAGTTTVADADGFGFGSLGIFPTEFAWYPVFAVSSTEPDFLIAADIVDDQMKTSIDGGLVWTADPALTRLVTGDGAIDFRKLEFTAASSIAVSPVNGRHIVVGTVQGGIVRSTDHGATWRRLAGSEMLPLISSFFFEDDTHLVVSTYGRGLWRVDLESAPATAAATPSGTSAAAAPPTHRARPEPLVVDPATGSFVRLDTFEARRTCPECRYVVAAAGEITDVQMTGLEVRNVKVSAGSLMAMDADRHAAAAPPAMPFAVDPAAGTFGGNPIVARLRAQRLPIRGLVLDGAVLKGILVSTEPIDLERPPAPVLFLETRDTMTGLAKAEPNESVIARGQRFHPDPGAPVVIRVGDREAARAQVAADGTFTAKFAVRELPGDYVVVAEQAGPHGPLVAKLVLKVTRRDRE